MPKYVSDDGKWKPSKEEVALTDKDGHPYIYKGDDRAAVEEIAAGNIESRPWYQHPETIAMIRQVHQMTVKEYMVMTGYDEKTTKAEVEKNLADINFHKPLPRKKQARHRSGGDNEVTGKPYGGNFGGEGDPRIDARVSLN